MIATEINNFESIYNDYNNSIQYEHQLNSMQFHIENVVSYHCGIYDSYMIEETIMVKNGPIFQIKYFLEDKNVHFENISMELVHNIELVHYLSTI